jgi:hypothetical protein
MITSMIKHFMFHILWISILRFLYFYLFSASFCITFLSNGTATPINQQVLSFLFLIIMSGLFAKTSLSVLLLLEQHDEIKNWIELFLCRFLELSIN